MMAVICVGLKGEAPLSLSLDKEEPSILVMLVSVKAITCSDSLGVFFQRNNEIKKKNNELLDDTSKDCVCIVVQETIPSI